MYVCVYTRSIGGDGASVLKPGAAAAAVVALIMHTHPTARAQLVHTAPNMWVAFAHTYTQLYIHVYYTCIQK